MADKNHVTNGENLIFAPQPTLKKRQTILQLWHCLCLFWLTLSFSLCSRGTTANLCRLAKTRSASLRSACWQWSRPWLTTLSWSLSWNSNWQPQTVLSSCSVAGTVHLTHTVLLVGTRHDLLLSSLHVFFIFISYIRVQSDTGCFFTSLWWLGLFPYWKS